jgi:Holliday junction resolvasome RuvABC endonuclease subunit
MPNILALDFATVTGWAHTCGESGTWDLNIRKDESNGMRLIRFRGKIREILACQQTDVIAFEAVSAMSGPRVNFNSVKLQCKLQAIIEEIVEDTPGLECVSYNIKEIKAHALPGKGPKNKEAMVNAAKKKFTEVCIIDDNHADALWLLSLAQGRIG